MKTLISVMVATAIAAAATPVVHAQAWSPQKNVEIVGRAIQRYAAEHSAETTTAKVQIPDDDMKGRIIGKEGRNIRAFEKATGIDVIVDDTPGVVSVSCFDPIRKEIARIEAGTEKLLPWEDVQRQIDKEILGR